MKLFHTENGKEAVYVQMQDMGYLANETDIPIPATIYEKVFTGMTVITDENRFEFVKFEDERDVNFFKEIEFIIDYEKYKDLTDEELEEEYRNLITKANEIAEKWNLMTQKERKKNQTLFGEHRNLEHMMNFLREIYCIKHNESSIELPEFVKNE